MRRILITGANSYIGTSFEKWVAQWPEEYHADTIDLKNGEWKELDFSGYDVVLHVAGIAHIKETSENQNLYYKVNRDLAFETANIAKMSGVKQFILLSSMSVYGIGKGIIDNKTPLKPNNAYGKSKLEAEKLIAELQNESFKVAILRPPMIYGKGCKGNYIRLSRLALKSPIFPNVNNKRSMIYIDNLSEFIKQLVNNQSSGFFFPQNAEYVNTSEMVKFITKAHGKQIAMIRLFKPIVRLLNINILTKVFGDLVYEMSMSEYESDYRIYGFKESIEITEEHV